MNRLLLAALAAAALLATAAAARAQPAFGTPGFAPPPTSFNWLNLRRGGNPAINYFNFVAPQVQANQAFANYQGPPLPGVQPGDEVALDPHNPTDRIPRPSGHASTFNSTGSYFNSFGTIGSAGRPAASAQTPQTGRRR